MSVVEDFIGERLVEEFLREKFDPVGSIKSGIQNRIVQPIKDKAADVARGVGTAALTAGAMYAGAKMGQERAEEDKEKANSEFSAEAQITDTVMGLDKQKYAQLSKIYSSDPELKKNHADEGAIINQVNTVLQKFKSGE